MKLIYLCTLLFISNPNLTEIRALYVKAAKSAESATELSQKLEGVSPQGPTVLVGYKAAAITLKAKREKGAKNKKERFKEGVDLLESLIAKEPNTVELRLIRLSIQENAPKLLKYHSDKDQDKKLLIAQYPSLKDKGLKVHIRDYVLQSDAFTSQEKALFSER